MVPRAFLCFFFALIAASNGDVGSCTRKNGPASWLTTKAHGLLGWGTAGTPPTGPNFCLQGSEDKSKVEVDYHIRLTNSAFQKIEKHTVNITKLAKQNACIDQNPEIHYCVPFCQIPSMQKLASEQAVASADPQTIAEAIYSHFFESNEWVVTVLNHRFADDLFCFRSTGALFHRPTWTSNPSWTPPGAVFTLESTNLRTLTSLRFKLPGFSINSSTALGMVQQKRFSKIFVAVLEM
ncbi:hypothetical protein L596_024048 [Steinernema carpocapsae]|uniref:Uncharacterized protein n=1 Tax=Steinernema carpocapsae TaxID=34508 RepID=A0A4U5MFK2_STECR|nr:hypothetical protein L596_024048 [Steinernema carpocapsae]